MWHVLADKACPLTWVEESFPLRFAESERLELAVREETQQRCPELVRSLSCIRSRPAQAQISPVEYRVQRGVGIAAQSSSIAKATYGDQ